MKRPLRRSFLSLLLTIAGVTTIAASQAAAQPTSFTPTGIGGGGAFFNPSFSPHKHDELYLTSDMSELFRTSDLGHSWSLLDFRQMQGGNIVGKVQYTNDPQLMYAISANGDALVPKKSTDGGATWQALASDPTDGAQALFVDYNNPQRLFISDYSQLYVSQDGGATWTHKYTAKDNGAGFVFAGLFCDGNTCYIGSNDGVLVSTDGGNTWQSPITTGIPSGEGIESFAGAKQSGTVRFFCVTVGTGDLYEGMTGSEHNGYKSVYTMDASSMQWHTATTGIASGDHPFFVASSPANPQTVYLAGGSDNGNPTIYSSTDNGITWISKLHTATNSNVKTGWSGTKGDRDWSYGEYALGFAVSPMDANLLAFSDLGFVHISTDGGSSWSAAYVNNADLNPAGSATPQGKSYHSIGLENTTCWKVFWVDSLTMLSAFADIRGIRSTDGGTTWQHVFDNQGINATYDFAKDVTGTVYAATSTVHDLYQSTYLTDARIDNGKGSILFSKDKGATWSMLHDFGHPVIWQALDPANSNRMYASVVNSSQGGIFVTNNLQQGAASTWTKLANPPRTEGHPFNLRILKDGSLLSTYSGRRNTAGKFTASSGVFLSTDAGTSWQDRSDANMQYWTKDLILDPTDATQSTWYVGVFSGWNGTGNDMGGLYRTSDRGKSWTRLVKGMNVTSAVFDPNDNNKFYYTTEQQGLWYTPAVHTASPQFTQVASYSFRQPERLFFNPYDPTDLWVTSFGNGMRHSGVTAVPTDRIVTMTSGNASIKNYPNPFSRVTILTGEGLLSAEVTLTLYDQLGRAVWSERSHPANGEIRLQYNADKLPNGVYELQLLDGSQRIARKIEISR